MFVLLNKCRHTTLGFFFNLRCVLSLKALSADNKKGFSIQQIFISARSFPFQCQTSDIFKCVLFSCTAAVMFLCAAVAARREAFVWNYPVMICSTDGSIKQKQQTAALNLWCVLQLTGPPGGQHIQTRAVVCLQKKILSLKTTNSRVVPCRPDSLWLDVEVLRRVSAVILRDVFKQVRTSFVHLGVSRVVSEETWNIWSKESLEVVRKRCFQVSKHVSVWMQGGRSWWTYSLCEDWFWDQVLNGPWG